MIAILLCSTSFFQEDFSNGLDAWTHSYWKGDESSSFVIGHGAYYGDETSLMTNESAKFYTISKTFESVSNSEKSLHFAYTVKNEQNIDCGGCYVKLYPPLSDLTAVRGGETETPYNIMFGPDFCGATKKVHFILNYNGTNVQRTKEISAPHDTFTHLYSFSLEPSGAYNVRIDGDIKASGDIHSDWPFLQPMQIPDPSASKPDDWSDIAEIDDPSDAKPDGYDDIPSEIPDPDATVPDDWNTEDDGEWEPPTIKNPEYKGPWKPKKMANPDYKGKWSAPLIANPEYEFDDTMGNYTFGAIGFEVWQVKAGTAFDSILFTNDVEELYTWGNKSQEVVKQEKSMYDAREEKKKQAEKETSDKEASLKDEV